MPPREEVEEPCRGAEAWRSFEIDDSADCGPMGRGEVNSHGYVASANDPDAS